MKEKKTVYRHIENKQGQLNGGARMNRMKFATMGLLARRAYHFVCVWRISSTEEIFFSIFFFILFLEDFQAFVVCGAVRACVCAHTKTLLGHAFRRPHLGANYVSSKMVRTMPASLSVSVVSFISSAMLYR